MHISSHFVTQRLLIFAALYHIFAFQCNTRDMYNHSSKKLVKYSLTKLAGGLFFHLRTKPFDEITITEICGSAGISRRTFYRNCEDKKDLILFSSDYLIMSVLDQTDFFSSDGKSLYLEFFRFWQKHKEFLALLHANGLFDLFIEEFVELCNRNMRYPAQEEAIKSASDQIRMRKFSNAFVIGGLCAILNKWIEEQFVSSPEDIVGSILYLTPQKDHLR